MNSYEIKRWDVILVGNQTKRPLIYITPDKPFLEFSRKNNNILLCVISGTDKNYNARFAGIVNTEGNVPNCRLNFFEKTGYCTITLLSNWVGYPNTGNFGKVTFYGTKGTEDSHKPKNEINKNSTDSVSKSEDNEESENSVGLENLYALSRTQDDLKEKPNKNGMQRYGILAVSGVLLAGLLTYCMLILKRKK